MQKGTLLAEEQKSLRVVIDGEHLQFFNEIKDERKLKFDSEVIRFALMEAAKASEFKLEEGYWQKIRQLMGFDFVRLNYHIYDIPGFINKALESFISEIENNVKSLLSFEARSKLDGLELDVAMAYIACQEESVAEHVSVETLAKKMNKRNTQELTEVLENFVHRGLLTKNRHDGTTYYHAKPVSLID
jgi:hypothetical protein